MSRLEPCASSPRETCACCPHRWRRLSSTVWSSQSRSDRTSPCGIFVGLHEVAERDRKGDIVGCGERVHAQLIFQPGDENREAERIETGVQQIQVIRQGSKLHALLGC